MAQRSLRQVSRCTVRGAPDETERVDLIAYLRTVSDNTHPTSIDRCARVIVRRLGSSPLSPRLQTESKTGQIDKKGQCTESLPRYVWHVLQARQMSLP